MGNTSGAVVRMVPRIGFPHSASTAVFTSVCTMEIPKSVAASLTSAKAKTSCERPTYRLLSPGIRCQVFPPRGWAFSSPSHRMVVVEEVVGELDECKQTLTTRAFVG
jgi:hypothetical protein